MTTVSWDNVLLTPIRCLFAPVPPGGEYSVSSLTGQLTTAMGATQDFAFDLLRLRNGAVQSVFGAPVTIANLYQPDVYRIFRTINLGVAYTEFTGAVGARAITLSAQPTLAVGGWYLICSSEPLHRLYSTVNVAQDVANALAIHQDVGGTWATVGLIPGATGDNTDVAGDTLKQTGYIMWAGLGTEQKTTRSVTVGGVVISLTGWWYRISHDTAALTNPSSLTDLAAQRSVNDWYASPSLPTGGAGRVIFRQGDYIGFNITNAAANGVATIKAFLSY